jgi:hypothetical protein
MMNATTVTVFVLTTELLSYSFFSMLLTIAAMIATMIALMTPKTHFVNGCPRTDREGEGETIFTSPPLPPLMFMGLPSPPPLSPPGAPVILPVMFIRPPSPAFTEDFI